MREWPSRTIVSTICPGRRQRERHDVDARHHHLVHAALAQLEHGADHLLLLGLDVALLPAPLDEDQQLLGGDRLVGHVADAEQAGDAVGDRREQPDERPQHDAEQLDRAREEERVALGVGERERLGHELAEDDRDEAHEERDDEQREDVSRAREPEGRTSTSASESARCWRRRTPRRGSR